MAYAVSDDGWHDTSAIAFWHHWCSKKALKCLEMGWFWLGGAKSCAKMEDIDGQGLRAKYIPKSRPGRELTPPWPIAEKSA
jgi:hypothetical protein